MEDTNKVIRLREVTDLSPSSSPSLDAPAVLLSFEKGRRKKAGLPPEYPTAAGASGTKYKTQTDINIELTNAIMDMATYCEQLSEVVETLEERVEVNERHIRLLIQSLKEYFESTKAEDRAKAKSKVRHNSEGV